MKILKEKITYIKDLVIDITIKQYDEIPYPRQMLAFFVEIGTIFVFCNIIWKLLGGL